MWIVFWASLIVLLLVISFHLDFQINEYVFAHQSPGWKSVARFISDYLNLPTTLVISLTLWLAGRKTNNSSWKRLALALAVSSCLAGIVSTSIRSVTGRTRPNAKVAQGWYGPRHDGRWTIGVHQYNSFPSGHVGTAMGFAAVLMVRERRWLVPGIAFVAAMGWSRIYLRCHNLSDVVVAGLIGLVVGWLVWRWFTSRLTPQQIE